MARLLYNGVRAELAAALDSDDTAISFAAPLTHSAGATVPTLTGGDYLPLVLLDADGRLAELVHLTAYAAGATTGTIARAQEGTAAVSHDAGVAVVLAPTVADLASAGGSDGGVAAVDATQVLAASSYDPAFTYYLTTGADLTALDADHIKISFTAPPSGAVLVRMNGLGNIQGGSAANQLLWGLLESGAEIASRQIFDGTVPSYTAATVEFLIDGLEPGSEHTYVWGHKTNAGSSVPGGFYIGGAAGPAVMVAQAVGPVPAEVTGGGSGGGSGEASGDDVLDLIDYAARLNYRRAYKKKAAGPTSGATMTVFEADGVGCIKHLWYAVAGAGYPMFDLRIKVYVDGETEPCIDTDLGMWGGYGFADVLASGAISTDFLYAKCYNGGSITHAGSRLPIPYQDGIRIDFVNPGGVADSLIFAQVDYASEADNPGMVAAPWRLRGNSHGVAAGLIGVAETSDHRLHTVAGAGALARLTLIAKNAGGTYTEAAGGGGTPLAYLEKLIGVTVDGEADRRVTSSGTEDFFEASYYYNGETPFSRPGSMGFGAETGGTFTTNQTLDLIGARSPVRFDDGCTVDWLANLLTEGPRAGCAAASLLLYYQRLGS